MIFCLFLLAMSSADDGWEADAGVGRTEVVATKASAPGSACDDATRNRAAAAKVLMMTIYAVLV